MGIKEKVLREVQKQLMDDTKDLEGEMLGVVEKFQKLYVIYNEQAIDLTLAEVEKVIDDLINSTTIIGINYDDKKNVLFHLQRRLRGKK